MIKLKALRPLRGDYGTVNEGDPFEAEEANARKLIQRGYAVERGGAKEAAKPENKAAPAPANKAGR